ncbi:MAG: hypothetical protein QM690_04660 [Sphingobium sp.]
MVAEGIGLPLAVMATPMGEKISTPALMVGVALEALAACDHIIRRGQRAVEADICFDCEAARGVDCGGADEIERQSGRSHVIADGAAILERNDNRVQRGRGRGEGIAEQARQDEACIAVTLRRWAATRCARGQYEM